MADLNTTYLGVQLRNPLVASALPLSKKVDTVRGVNCCPRSETTLDNSVLAALDQSGLPAFLPHSGRLAHQVMSTRAHGLERAPVGTSDSPTTFTCMLTCIRAWPASLGCPSTGFCPPTCSRRARGASLRCYSNSPGRRLFAWLPMPFLIERAMHVH